MLTPAAGTRDAAGMSSLIRVLREVERAEQMALQLRREHGPVAEAVCDAERARHLRRAPDWRFWTDVRRSLRWAGRADAQSTSVARR
jgi:hypothetical protein